MFPICSQLSSAEIMLLTYHDENRQGTADRPATEITEAMIAAGVEAISRFRSDDPVEAIVWAVLSAAIPLMPPCN